MFVLTNRRPCKREEHSCSSQSNKLSINCDNNSEERELSVPKVKIDDVALPNKIINNAQKLIDAIKDNLENQHVNLAG